MRCPNCDIDTDDKVCPECGTTVLSDPDDILEGMIERASVPNLAALFKAGKDKGLLKPQQEYGH